jgi:hypothetical protein
VPGKRQVRGDQGVKEGGEAIGSTPLVPTLPDGLAPYYRRAMERNGRTPRGLLLTPTIPSILLFS